MGYYRKTEEHAFKRIEQDLRKDNFPNVVLLCGSERFLVDFYRERLAKAFVNDALRALDLVILSGEELKAQAIIESCEIISMGSLRKVVIVPDFEPVDGKRRKGFSESDLKDLTDYIEGKDGGVPESTLLIFTGGETEGKSKQPPLRKAIAAAPGGAVYDFQTLDGSLLRGFIEKRLRASGKNYRPSLVSAIIAETGYGNKYIDYTLYNLDNDLQKLAAYASEEITTEDVRAVFATNPENNIFSLLDDVSRNRKGDALAMLHNLFDAKMDPFMIQAMIVRQLELILYTKELSDNGHSLQEISKLAGELESAGRKGRRIPEFRIKKALGIGKGISDTMLRHMLTGAYEIDRNVKFGTFDPKLALEYYISNN